MTTENLKNQVDLTQALIDAFKQAIKDGEL